MTELKHTEVVKISIIDVLAIKKESVSPCIQETIEYLNQNFREKISISELSESMFISKSYLMHEFKRVTGKGIHKYLTELRINYAASLISSGVKIQISSELAGYQDYSSFYRNFQKHMGVSPKEYQISMQGG